MARGADGTLGWWWLETSTAALLVINWHGVLPSRVLFSYLKIGEGQMKGFSFSLLCILFSLASSMAWPNFVFPSGTEIFPLSQVERGLEGYGLTVMQGRDPIRFQVRVLDVVEDFAGPKHDAIIVEISGKEVERTRVAAGMSGSPIFFAGRLAGALAYAWPFGQEPVGGVTPIEEILAEAKRDVPDFSEDDSFPWQQESSHGMLDSRCLGVPLLCSGFSEQGLRAFEDFLPSSLIPIRGGGGASKGAASSAKGASRGAASSAKGASKGAASLADATPGASDEGVAEAKRLGRSLQGGDAVGIQLIRGDFSAMAVGTVTCVLEDRVLAFGHPFMNAGFWRAPMVAAEVHHVLASRYISFKLSSPLDEQGSLILDRPPCIVGKLGERADMAGLSIETINLASRKESEYELEVLQHPRLTVELLAVALRNALVSAESTRRAIGLQSRAFVELEGGRSFWLENRAFHDGSGPFDPIPLFSLMEILDNPFTPLALSNMEVKVVVKPGVRPKEIVSVVPCEREVRQGETLAVRIRFRSYGGEEFSKRFVLQLPREIPPGRAVFRLASGSALPKLRSEPKSVDDLIEQASNRYHSSTLVARIRLPYRGVGSDGRRLERLPGVAMELLSHGESKSIGEVKDQTFALPWMIEGGGSFSLLVRRRLER